MNEFKEMTDRDIQEQIYKKLIFIEENTSQTEKHLSWIKGFYIAWIVISGIIVLASIVVIASSKM